MKRWVADQHAQAPMRLITLAEQLKHKHPEKVKSVLDKYLPIILQRVQWLENDDQEYFDYTAKLEALEKEEGEELAKHYNIPYLESSAKSNIYVEERCNADLNIMTE